MPACYRLDLTVSNVFFCRTEQDIAMATKMDEFADELMPTRKVTPVKRVSVLAKED